MTNDNTNDLPILIAETDNYSVLTSVEDNETTYHLDLGQVTVHFFEEEWEEFVGLIGEASAADSEGSDQDDVEVELDWGSLYFSRDEWNEFLNLIGQVSEE